MLIYIVEDDTNICELETYALKNSGFEVKGFPEGKSFMKEMTSQLPDLILLDIMLPGEDGMSILKKIRSNTIYSRIPIIMVTAKSTEIDTVKGLDAGADDYICKPFGVMELISRVKARLRRAGQEEESIKEFDGIKIDPKSRTVTADGKDVELTYKEFELLKMLMSRPEMVFRREFIMDEIWGYDYNGSGRTLDMHIKTLRQKLGKKGALIKTVRNVGYKISKTDE